MQVLHREQEGLPLTGVPEQVPQQRKGPRLAHLWAERGQRRQVHGHVQELEQQKRLGLGRHPGLAQTLVDGGRDGRRGGCVREAPELAEEVAHWQVRGGAAIGQAVAFAIRHRLPVQAAGEFRQQPRLPHPRLPSDADHLPLPADRLCQSRVQERQFLGAAHKATQGPRVAPWDARPPPPETADRIHVHRGRGYLGCEGLPRLALHLVLYQSVCGSTDKDGIGRGLLLEPSRYMERVANCSVGQLRVVYQGADHHGPRVQSQAERYAVRLLAKRVRRVQTLTQLEGRQHRPAGMVLLRHRRPKQGQEALAGDLEEGAVVALHRVLDQRQHGAHQVVHGLRPQARRQGGRLGQCPA